MREQGNAVDNLRQSLDAMILQMEQLGEDVNAREATARKQMQAARLERVVWVAFAILIFVLMGVMLNVANQNNAIIGKLVDCTTPGEDHECYKRGQERTAKAVGEITFGALYAVECARLYPNESGPQFDKKLEACVTAKLKASRAQK